MPVRICSTLNCGDWLLIVEREVLESVGEGSAGFSVFAE